MTRVRVTEDLDIGVATHVGRVRTANEDDYLVYLPPVEDARNGGRLFAIADGMGGVAGGGQASRAALRALGATLAVAAGEGEDAGERLTVGFAAASERVHTLAAESAVLADMGTTMTALLLVGGRAVVAHVGDTRCLRIRGASIEQLTEDHAMREPRNLLTRAIGAGQRHETVDIVDAEVRPGDLFVLVTDGVWGVVEPEEIARELRAGPLQDGCEEVLARVFERGAPDNATLVAVRAIGTEIGPVREVELPAAEARIGLPEAGSDSRRIAPASWPYLLLVASVLLGVLAWLRVTERLDVFELVRSLGG